jgi:hypothetical protein
VWSEIKKAVEQGKLGDSAKAATARPNPHAATLNEKVICIYTYDWADKEDVRRVREELRKLGITNKIPYKADEDILRGKYRATGHDRDRSKLEEFNPRGSIKSRIALQMVVDAEKEGILKPNSELLDRSPF